MRCSLDKVLLDARQLASRIRSNDETADMLIKQVTDARSSIVSKKKSQEELLSFEEIGAIVAGRPRRRLMMCVVAENKRLERLSQENKVLRTSIAEHEQTLDIIMGRFRSQKRVLRNMEQLEPDGAPSSHCRESIMLILSRLVSLKRQTEDALAADYRVAEALSEIEAKLLLENRELRRLRQINIDLGDGGSTREVDVLSGEDSRTEDRR